MNLLAADTADLAPVLERKDVNLVIVTTPSGAHLEPAVAAAKAGKHVVVEKPLEITTERCDRTRRWSRIAQWPKRGRQRQNSTAAFGVARFMACRSR